MIRRDLRLSDNHALAAALKEGDSVLPVFILDEKLLSRKADNRHNFLLAGLFNLDRNLNQLGSRLIIRYGDPLIELPQLVEECGIRSVYAEEDISPYSIKRDTVIGKRLQLHLINGISVHPIPSITKSDGKPYTVFTPYSQVWLSLPKREQVIPSPDFSPPIPKINSLPIPEFNLDTYFPSGEQEAMQRLSSFMDGPIFQYSELRNRLDLDSTSCLSPYIRFGMVSINQVVVAARHAEQNAPDEQTRESCRAWLRQLIWREFYQSILFHYPHVLRNVFKPKDEPNSLEICSPGITCLAISLTGYPVIDAGMRQLAVTGWMHNRARMLTASFLTKDLLINQQEGEAWFMRLLTDGDPAANNGGWQWVAGTGTDASPYFRIFNPVIQGKKFDPQGTYIYRWVPELTDVPLKYIRAPWEMSLSEQKRYNVLIGGDYPVPLVEHHFARQRALDIYSQNR